MRKKKKEILQSQNETLEQEILENQKNQGSKIEDICKSLPKVIDLISQTEINILERVNQRMNDHESKYKHITKCIGFKSNSN